MRITHFTKRKKIKQKFSKKYVLIPNFFRFQNFFSEFFFSKLSELEVTLCLGVGNINGKPVIDFDIDSMKDKPWLKKGENISDYFNYGFTEDTWKVYQVCTHSLSLSLDMSHII